MDLRSAKCPFYPESHLDSLRRSAGQNSPLPEAAEGRPEQEKRFEKCLRMKMENARQKGGGGFQGHPRVKSLHLFPFYLCDCLKGQRKLCPDYVTLTSGNTNPSLEAEGRVMPAPVCCYYSCHLQLTRHFGFTWTQNKKYTV